MHSMHGIRIQLQAKRFQKPKHQTPEAKRFIISLPRNQRGRTAWIVNGFFPLPQLGLKDSESAIPLPKLKNLLWVHCLDKCMLRSSLKRCCAGQCQRTPVSPRTAPQRGLIDSCLLNWACMPICHMQLCKWSLCLFSKYKLIGAVQLVDTELK